MKPLRTLLAIYVLFLGIVILTYKDASAGEWQDKPIVCTQLEEIKQGLAARGEIKIFEAIQITTVRDMDTLSDTPVYLPLSIWVNPKDKTYTIIEFHPGYNSYCVISYGAEWTMIGETL